MSTRVATFPALVTLASASPALSIAGVLALGLLNMSCGRVSYDSRQGDADLCTTTSCDMPPSDCFEVSGQCTNGSCSYTPRSVGASCDDMNIFTENDTCNADSVCIGSAANYWPLVFDNKFSGVQIRGLGIDSSGALFGAVRFEGVSDSISFDSNLSAPGIYIEKHGAVDFALFKLAASDASFFWGNSYAGTSGRVEPYTFEFLPDGTVFTAGYLRGRGEFGSFGSADVGDTENPLVFAHGPSGGSISAMQTYSPGSQNAQIHGMSVSASYVALAGIHGDNVDFGAGGLGPVSNGEDGFFAVFDRAFNLQWARAITGDGLIYGTGAHLGDAGTSWVAGDFANTVDYGDGLHAGAGRRDVYFASYTPSGALRWGHTWGSSTNEEKTQLIGDSRGNTYVVGAYSDSFSISTSSLPTTRGGQDLYVAAFDNLGALRWLQTFGSEASDSLVKIGFLNDGSLWIGGGFDGTLEAGTLSATSTSGTDGYVVVLNASDGTATGLSVMASESDLALQAIAVDQARSLVWVGGALNGTVELGDATASGGKAYIYPFRFSP